MNSTGSASDLARRPGDVAGPGPYRGERWCGATRLRDGMEGAPQRASARAVFERCCITPACWISGGTQRHGVSARPQGAPLRVSRETAPNVWAHRLSPRMRSSTFTGRVDRVPGEGHAPLWPVRQRRVEAGAVGTPGVRGLRRVPGVDKARCGGSSDLGVVGRARRVQGAQARTRKPASVGFPACRPGSVVAVSVSDWDP